MEKNEQEKKPDLDSFYRAAVAAGEKKSGASSDSSDDVDRSELLIISPSSSNRDEAFSAETGIGQGSVHWEGDEDQVTPEETRETSSENTRESQENTELNFAAFHERPDAPGTLDDDTNGKDAFSQKDVDTEKTNDGSNRDELLINAADVDSAADSRGESTSEIKENEGNADSSASENSAEGDGSNTMTESVIPAYEEKKGDTTPAPQRNDSLSEEDEEDEDAPSGIMDHFREMRQRIVRILLVIIVGFFPLFAFSEDIYSYISAPMQACLPEGCKMIYTSPQGMFFTYMKVAFLASLVLTIPHSFYQIWAFIAPGLYKSERRAVVPLAFVSSIFFLVGAFFCFFAVVPLMLRFFMGFATDQIVPMISVEEYLSLILKIVLAFGLVFEMPIFAFFLARFGILTPQFMREKRRYAIVLAFIVGAVLTPPDVFSQIMLAGPIIVLYEVSIYICAAAGKKDREREQKKEEGDE